MIMKIVNGIVYASTEVDILKIVDVKVLDNKMLLLEFNNNEQRLYDASVLLSMPVFEQLKDDNIFKSCKLENGIITWLNGEIDIATETIYAESFLYSRHSLF